MKTESSLVQAVDLRSHTIVQKVQNKSTVQATLSKGYWKTQIRGWIQKDNSLSILWSTVECIIKKWKECGTGANVTTSGHPQKLSERARRGLVKEVIKTRVAPLKLQAFALLLCCRTYLGPIRCPSDGTDTLLNIQSALEFQASTVKMGHQSDKEKRSSY